VPHLWFKIACIGFAFGAVEFARWGDNAPDQEPAPQRTKLQERLPGERGEIISMSMQDHYVEVTSTGGVDLILMRMSDAIGELDGLPGIRLHRSHWAALAHVAAVEKDGQRWKALLSDGRALPISNTYIGPLRQAFEGKVSSAPRTKIAAGRSRVNTAT
jgi:DNA-binding LytR/AlgR family response regulator